MDVRIQNIDLSINLASSYQSANLENDIRQRFINRVLKPLDATYGNKEEISVNDIVIPDMAFDESISSLSSLDKYFDKLRKKIELEIQSGIDNKRATILSQPRTTTSNNEQDWLLTYLEKGKVAHQINERDWQKLIEKTGIKTLIQQIKIHTSNWTISSTARLLELFSFEEIVTFLYKNISDKKKMRLELQHFWFNHSTTEESFISTKETASIIQYLDYILGVIIKESSITKRDFELANVQLLMKAAGVRTQQDGTDKMVKDDLEKQDETNKIVKDKLGKKEITAKEIIELNKIEFNTADSKRIMLDKVRLKNTGLFLLHIFLPQFFKQQKIWIDGEIKNYNRAALLLHYMATGENTPKNFQLNTVKILLGLLPNDALYIQETMNEAEMESCDDLLNAVIQHWSSLGNISPYGLRQMFLQRKGMAILKDNNWRIEIEHQAQDILIERMPWGLGVIKLPWMKNIVEVSLKK